MGDSPFPRVPRSVLVMAWMLEEVLSQGCLLARDPLLGDQYLGQLAQQHTLLPDVR